MFCLDLSVLSVHNIYLSIQVFIKGLQQAQRADVGNGNASCPPEAPSRRSDLRASRSRTKILLSTVWASRSCDDLMPPNPYNKDYSDTKKGVLMSNPGYSCLKCFWSRGIRAVSGVGLLRELTGSTFQFRPRQFKLILRLGVQFRAKGFRSLEMQ